MRNYKGLIAFLFLLPCSIAFAYDCNDARDIPSDKITILLDAQSRDDSSAVRTLLSLGVHGMLRQYGVGNDYYMWSVCEGNSDLFLFLLNNTPADAKSAQSALAGALEHIIVYQPKNFLTAQELFERGLPIEAPIQHMGIAVVDETALLASVNHIRPNVGLINYLIDKKANIFATDRDKKTALHKALDLLDPYLTGGDQLGTIFGASPFLDIIDKLISAAGERRVELVNQSDRYDMTPLSRVSRWLPRDDFRTPHYKGYEDYYKDGVQATAQGIAIDKLLAAGADINLAVNGRSALGSAVSKGNSYLTEFLLSRGANPTGWKRYVRPNWESYFSGNDSESRMLLERGRRMMQILENAEKAAGSALAPDSSERIDIRFVEIAEQLKKN